MFLFKYGLITLSLLFFIASTRQNPFVGYRTKITLSDQKIWRKANISFGIYLLVSGLIVLLFLVETLILKHLAFANGILLTASIIITELIIRLWPASKKS